MRDLTLSMEHARTPRRPASRSFVMTGALAALLFAGNEIARADDWDDGRYWRGHPQGYGYGHGGGYGSHGRPYCPPRRPHVVVENYYYPPAPVAYVPSQTVVYGPPQVVYAPPQPVYAPPPVVYSAPAYGSYGSGNYGNGDRLLRSAVFGAAGGYLGSRIGSGSGRAAATAAGALGGWLLGNRVQW